MERELLAGWLNQGLSIGEISERAGRAPSTVSYWLNNTGCGQRG